MLRRVEVESRAWPATPDAAAVPALPRVGVGWMRMSLLVQTGAGSRLSSRGPEVSKSGPESLVHGQPGSHSGAALRGCPKESDCGRSRLSKSPCDVRSAWLSPTPLEPMRFLLLPMAEAVVDGGAQETRRPDRVRVGGWLLPLVAPRLKLQALEPESAEGRDVAEKHPFPDTQ